MIRKRPPAIRLLNRSHAAYDGSGAMLAFDDRVIRFFESRQPHIPDNFRLHIAHVVLRELVVRRISGIFDELRLGNPGTKARAFNIGIGQIGLHPLGVIGGLGLVALLNEFGKRGFRTATRVVTPHEELVVAGTASLGSQAPKLQAQVPLSARRPRNAPQCNTAKSQQPARPSKRSSAKSQW